MVSAISFIWLVNGFFWFGPALLFDCFCKDETRTNVHRASFVVFNILPLVIIFVMYIGIIYEIFIKRQEKRLFRTTNGLQLQGAVTIIWVVLFLLLSSVPSSIFTFIFIFNEGQFVGLYGSSLRLMSVFVNILNLSNCVFNPVIYSLRMKSFKATLLSRISPKPVIAIKIIHVRN